MGKMFHPAGANPCRSCYNGYPKPCHSPGCKGLLHAVKGNEPDDGESTWLHIGCDVCDLRESVIPERLGAVTVMAHIQGKERSRSMVMQGETI